MKINFNKYSLQAISEHISELIAKAFANDNSLLEELVTLEQHVNLSIKLDELNKYNNYN